jgi:hypothetical protein
MTNDTEQASTTSETAAQVNDLFDSVDLAKAIATEQRREHPAGSRQTSLLAAAELGTKLGADARTLGRRLQRLTCLTP